MKLFTIRDHKAEFFHNPQAFRTVSEALRQFESEAKNENSMINKHPEDYTLYEIGEFNQDTGHLITLEVIKPLAPAMDFVQTN
jgi:hypothetical protein